jgi:hypothetical protein
LVKNSPLWSDETEALHRFDDVKLKERATKLKEFFNPNNEMATKAFCRISKEGRYGMGQGQK